MTITSFVAEERTATLARFNRTFGVPKPQPAPRPVLQPHNGLHPSALAEAALPDAPAPKRGLLRCGLALLGAVTVVAGLATVAGEPEQGTTAVPTAAIPASALPSPPSTTLPPTTLPPPPPVIPSTTEVDYPWLVTRADGGPVTWPCGPIGYRLVVETSPPGAERLLRDTTERISAVSGLQFREDPAVATLGEDGTGYRGITVAWVPAAQLQPAGDSSNPIGTGGGTHRDGHYVHGWVRLLNDRPANTVVGFGAGTVGSVLLHEVGHALGLGHVDDVSAVMNPVDLGVTEWTDTETAALQRLNQQCAR